MNFKKLIAFSIIIFFIVFVSAEICEYAKDEESVNYIIKELFNPAFLIR